MMNLLVVVVYWSVIHVPLVKNMSGAKLIHMYLVHSWPAICFIMTSMTIESIYLNEYHYIFSIPFCLVYCYVNYLETKANSKPVYWFLTWEDYTSPLICAGLELFIIVAWIILAKLSKFCSNKGK